MSEKRMSSNTTDSLESWLKSHKKFNSEHTYFYSDLFKIPLNTIFGESANSIQKVEKVSTIFNLPNEVPTRRGLTCLTCGLEFSDHLQQQAHFKSTFHFYNLKRKIKGESPVTLSSFEQLNPSVQDPQDDKNEESSDSEEEAQDSEEDNADNEYVFENSLVNGTGTEDSFKNIYTDEKGKIEKVFHAQCGPQFRIQCPSFFPWQFHVSISMFPRDTLFARRDWSYTTENIWLTLHRQIEYLRTNPIMAVFILRSGKFAAAIYDNSNPKNPLLVHKVIRRYTVRAKAGGGQSSYDSKGGKAKSMGAQLRRYGEKALQEDIANIFTKWQDYISNCGLILIATTKRMQTNLLDDDLDSALLKKNDARIVFVPFVVEKPTLVSTQIIREKCLQVMFTQQQQQMGVVTTSTSITVEGAVQEDEATATELTQYMIKLSTISEEDTLQHKLEDSEDDDENEVAAIQRALVCPYSQQLISMVTTLEDAQASEAIALLLKQFQPSMTTSTIAAITQEVDGARRGNGVKEVEEEEVELEVEEGKVLEDCEYDGWKLSSVLSMPHTWEDLASPLHLAAQSNKAHTIGVLLLAGANPEQQDARGRAAYFLASSKEARDAFRKSRGDLGEFRWNWSKTGIPEPITDEKVQQQRLKEKEKKKRATQRKKEQKEKAEVDAKQALETMRIQEELKKQQMIAFEEEQRRRAGQCAACTVSLYKRDFYEILDARCCSPECMAKYKRKLAADAALARFGKK